MSEELNDKTQSEQTDNTDATQSIENLKQAKQHEKEARQAAEAKVRELERTVLDLQSKAYGDEDKVKNSPLYKNMELTLQKQQEEVNKLKESLNLAQGKLDDVDLAKEISRDETVLPSAIDDIITQMKMHGFKKTEKGWLDGNGKGIADFIGELHTSKEHYFKRTIGSKSSPYIKELESRKNMTCGDILRLGTSQFINK